MSPLLSAHFKDVTMISVNGWQPKDILTAITDLVQTKARGNPADFDHILIIMPTLFRQDELSGMGEEIIERQKPEWGRWKERKDIFQKIGETLMPMKYKMVIGPGSAETWKFTGDIPTDMTPKELYSVFSKNDVPVISGMPLHRRLKTEEYNFKAWPVDLEPFPAYLAATVELTMQIATLKDAMHCLQTPTASRKRTARPASEVLRTEETITSSHKEEIKNFIQTRDKKIRISKQPVTNAAVVNDILQTLVDGTNSSSLPPAYTTVGRHYRDKEIDSRSQIAYRAMQIYFRELKLDWASSRLDNSTLIHAL
jgi:hypothetical protein